MSANTSRTRVRADDGQIDCIASAGEVLELSEGSAEADQRGASESGAGAGAVAGAGAGAGTSSFPLSFHSGKVKSCALARRVSHPVAAVLPPRRSVAHSVLPKPHCSVFCVAAERREQPER